MARTPLNPIPPDDFGYAEAQHVLGRAGFGGTPEQITQLAALGPAAAVDLLVDYERTPDPDDAEFDSSIIAPLSAEQRRQFAQARRSNDQKTIAKFRAMRQLSQREDREQLGRMRQWWLRRMITTARPLQERLVLLWHGHFAVNYRGCQDSFLLYQQNQMFRKHANGSFADLAVNIVRDPAMLVFLNNDRNIRRNPNENLARELMELFTLGEGNYTERDIKEGARALTGYGRDDDTFRFNTDAHDTGSKTILGRRGRFDGEDFAKLCLAQPACARFIATKLYAHFVGDLAEKPTAAQQQVIDGLADRLQRSKYRLKPVLKTLFRSQHFYEASVRGAMIKSPIQLAVGTVRVLRTPARNTDLLAGALRMMGQELFNPPNVAGWPGGRAWINTATLFVRQNLSTYLISGKPPFEGGWKRSDIRYDATALIASLKRPTPESVVEHLARLLFGASMPAQRKPMLTKFVRDHGQPITNDTLVGLLCLMTALPEYQLH